MIEERLNLYKQMYYFELEQKEKINSRISIPLGVIVVLIGGMGYFFKYINKMPNEIWVGYYKISLFSFGLLIICSILFVIRAYYGYEYMYVSIPCKLEENYTKLVDYYDNNYEEYFKDYYDKSKDCLIKEDFYENLIKQYVDTTDHNSNLNKRKLNLLRVAGWILLLSIIFGISTYLLFTTNYNF